MELNLDFARARRLLLPTYQLMTMTLIGCGGTGSWLAPAVVRVGRLLQERFGKEVTLTFVDPDTVESQNVYRQNFCQAEVGGNKAEALAYRYGLAWGMEVRAVREPFGRKALRHELGSDLRIMIGCVDNAAARATIQGEAQMYGAWWLDCGNEKNSGQVLVGGGKPKKNADEIPGFCGRVPLPGEQHPELVDVQPVVEQPRNGDLSCAEMALLDSQGLAINQRMAAEAADYLVRMLVTHDLRKFATYIDLESGVSRSEYITDERMAAWTQMK